jgi:uncharacterized protein (TIGR02646 family)
MRTIAKNPEPHSLTEHRAANPTDYIGYPDKDALRASLATEQRGLCCYCQGRIRASIGSMKIEHWQSHSGYPNQRLVYRNLLGACMGGEGQRGNDQHCDTFKAERDLSRNPAEHSHNVGGFIHSLSDGRITSSNPVFDRELNEILNLNLPVLKNSRRDVLRAFQRTLQKRRMLTRLTWVKLLGEWNGESDTGELNPYCSVIVYWIEKKLARLTR